MTISKKALFIFILFFLCCIVVLILKIPRELTLTAPFKKGAISVVTDKNNTKLVAFIQNNMTIYLEVANTEQQRELGLMYRESMPENHGMIFLFEKPQRLSFWMKNTLIPLDMIFLNHDKVVAILRNIPPCKKNEVPCPSYEPNVQADEVIELNAEVAKHLAIKVGDKILLS